MEQGMRNACHSERSEESRALVMGSEIPSTSSGQALRFAQDDKPIHSGGVSFEQSSIGNRKSQMEKPMPELSISDFSFTGRLGSQGARIARVGRNHFHIELGHAPGHPEWCNLLQFEILRNAKGNRLRLDVAFATARRASSASTTTLRPGPMTAGTGCRSTWKIRGRNGYGEKSDTLEFPEFTEDRVFFGAQVPMSYEDVVEFMEHYGRAPGCQGARDRAIPRRAEHLPAWKSRTAAA